MIRSSLSDPMYSQKVCFQRTSSSQHLPACEVSVWSSVLWRPASASCPVCCTGTTDVTLCLLCCLPQVSVLHLRAVPGVAEAAQRRGAAPLPPGGPLLLRLPCLVHERLRRREGAARRAVQARYSSSLPPSSAASCSSVLLSGICPLSTGEHVTSWFKNEVERMGFETQNAWRISDINSKFR